MVDVYSGCLRRCRPLLGTFVEITAPAAHAAAVNAAFAAISHVHACMSFHEPASDLARIAEAPVGAAVRVDPCTMEVLKTAAKLHEWSGGLFDVAIGGRLVATGFLPRLRTADLRRLTGTAADIELVDSHHVRCQRSLLIDLGGIAKGYAVDRAIDILVQAGARQAVVNAGGDLRVMGTDPLFVPLRSANGVIERALQIANGAVASSSNLHLRRRYRGRLVTPHLGEGRRPVLSENATTVIAERCMIADAMTKVALAAPALAAEMLSELGGEIVSPEAWRQAA